MNSHPIPEYYGVTHLFLVTGRNPLPNYVSARLLLKPEGKLYLIHTEDTEAEAQSVAANFQDHDPQLIRVDPLEPLQLREKVTAYLGKTSPEAMGFDYTGGTKLMAVHTRLAVEEFCQKRGRKSPVFSYLNADTLEMLIEPWEGYPVYRKRVIEAVQPSFDDVFKLHQIKLKERFQTEPLMLELAEQLALLNGNGVEAWKMGRNILRDKDNKTASWAALKKMLQDVGVTAGVLDQMERTLGLADSQRVHWDLVGKKAGLKSGNELQGWLSGLWLEHWTLACIKSLGYKMVARNLKGHLLQKSRPGEWRSPQEFEIDVALLRGYQLFAISCGVTPNVDEAKLKFFEIYTRSHQLGGDEARAGLVCAVKDPELLEHEIVQEWDARGRVKVFGRQHFPHLEMHLKEWFESV